MKLPVQKIVYLFTSIVFVGTILLSVIASSEGAKLVGLEKKIKTLESQNRELETSLIAKDSLKKVSENISDTGLKSNPLVLYWNQDVSVATAH